MRIKMFKQPDGRFTIISKANRPTEKGRMVDSGILQKDVGKIAAAHDRAIRGTQQRTLPDE